MAKIKVRDIRKVNPITKKPLNPNRDLKNPTIDPYVAEKIIRESLGYGVDPYLGLAVGLQESNLGNDLDPKTKVNTSSNPLRVNSAYHGISEDPTAQGIAILRDKYNSEKNKNEALKIQAFNGLTPKTRANPAYGKNVISLRDSVIKQTPEFIDLVNQIKQPPPHSPETPIQMKKPKSRLTQFYKENPKPMYGKGGFLKKAGNTFQDLGLGIADSGLSMLGASNVITPETFANEKFGKFAEGYAGFAQKAAPMVAGAALGPLGASGAKMIQQIGGQFNPQEQVQEPLAGNAIMQDPNQVQYSRFGGPVNRMNINVEGINRQAGTPMQMKKGELLARGGRVLRRYAPLPPHPEQGMDPMGTVQANEGDVVISKPYSERYLNSGRGDRKMIEGALASQQRIRDMQMAKKGGMVQKYALAGVVGQDESYGNTFDPLAYYGGTSPDNIQIPEASPYVPRPQDSRSMMNLNAATTPGYAQNKLINKVAGNYGVDPVNFYQSDLSEPAQIMPAPNAPNAQSPGTPPSGYGTLGNDLMTAASPLYNLGVAAFGKAAHLNRGEYMNNRNLDWEKMSDRESLAANQRNYRTGLYNMKNSGKFGLAGQTALANARMGQDANSIERINNMNAEGRFKSKLAYSEQNERNNLLGLNIAKYNQDAQDTKMNHLAAAAGDISEYGMGRNNQNAALDAMRYFYTNPQFQEYKANAPAFKSVNRRTARYNRKQARLKKTS